MGHMSYDRVGRCHGMRGIKLNCRRFSVQRLRAKFLYLFKIFGHALRLLKKNFNTDRSRKQKGNTESSYGSSKKNLVSKQADYAMYGNRSDYRLKSYARSNSFYAEAIADCLDFIKRNSLSMEETPVLSHQIS